MAKPMGFDTIPEIKRALREIPGPHMATLSQAAGPKARSLSELEAAGVCSATFPSIALFAAANAVRNVVRAAQARATRWRPARSISFRSTITTIWSGSRTCWRARRATTRQPPRWCRSARLNSRGALRCRRWRIGWSRGGSRVAVFPAARRRKARRSSTRAASSRSWSATRSATTTTSARGCWPSYLSKQLPGQPVDRGAEHAAGGGAGGGELHLRPRAARRQRAGLDLAQPAEPGGDEAAEHRGRCAPLHLARRDVVPRPHLRRDRGGARQNTSTTCSSRSCWSAASASARRPASCRP